MRGRKRLRKKIFKKGPGAGLPRECVRRSFELSDPMLRRRARKKFLRSLRISIEGFNKAFGGLGVSMSEATKMFESIGPKISEAAGFAARLEKETAIKA